MGRKRPAEIDLDSPIKYEPGQRERAASALIRQGAEDLLPALDLEGLTIRVCEARATINGQRTLSHQRVAPDVELDGMVEREMIDKLVAYAWGQGLILREEDIEVTWREETLRGRSGSGAGGAGSPADAGAAADG